MVLAAHAAYPRRGSRRHGGGNASKQLRALHLPLAFAKGGAELRVLVASGNLLDFGAAVPESYLLNLAYRYGGKARFETATTCRFLLEAPPLGNDDRSDAVH